VSILYEIMFYHWFCLSYLGEKSVLGHFNKMAAMLVLITCHSVIGQGFNI